MPAVLRDVSNGLAFPLEDFTLIGRGENVTVNLSDSGVSRQHATIRRENRDYWIVDLGSANGSYVNGVELTSARVLRNGDRIQLGNLTLLFEYTATVVMPEAGAHERTQISFASPAPVASQAVTLFVADLKGFTQMSATLSPDEVAALLREWYADCQSILRQFGATIDKFIGDSVFAFWPGIDIATRAKALTAARTLRSVEIDPASPVRILLKTERDISLDCRIGIHVGTVAVGQMGKGITTALGDAVNIVFRIEALTRSVMQPILVSAEFAQGWRPEDGCNFRSCGRHEVKGGAEPIEVFAPLG